MYVEIFKIAYAHCILLHLEHVWSSHIATGCKEKHNSHLGRCKDVSPHEIAGMGVNVAYFSTDRCIERSHQKEYRFHDYEVPIYEEEDD